MVRIVRTWPIWLLLIVATAPGAGYASAQQGGVEVHVTSVAPIPRGNAPFWVHVELESREPELVVGCLDVVFSGPKTRLGRYRSGELAVAPGMQSVRMMLPPLRTSSGDGQCQAYVRFVTDEVTYESGRQPFRAPSTWRRSFVVCAGLASGAGQTGYGSVARGLLLERFDPEPAPATLRTYASSLINVEPEDLPSGSLGYCAYDLLLLAGEGFSRMRRRQLNAVRAWVAAGGSVCVLPHRGCKAHHLEFLNELAGKGPPVFGRPTDVVSRLGADASQSPGLYRYGLGRAVILPTGPYSTPHLDSPVWRQAVAFLWKVSKSQLGDFAGRGEWSDDVSGLGPVTVDASLQATYGPGGALSSMTVFQQAGFATAQQVCEALLPGEVGFMPTGLLLLLFVAFLLVIGPGDYFVLGALRLRRYTWLLFPVTCVGFAALIVVLSSHYMGGGGPRNELVVIDVGRDGRVLRWSRYELAFLRSEREEVARVQNSLYAHVDARLSVAQMSGLRAREGDQVNPVPVFRGRFPAGFEVHRSVRKWTPLMYRRSSFSPVEVRPQLDWGAFGGSSAPDTAERLREARRVLPADGLDDSLFLVTAKTTYQVHEGKGVRAGRRSRRSQDSLAEIARSVSVAPPGGLFALVSQTSPKGGGDFEDLWVLDRSDDSQCALVAVRQTEGDLVLVRCVYYGDRG